MFLNRLSTNLIYHSPVVAGVIYLPFTNVSVNKLRICLYKAGGVLFYSIATDFQHFSLT